MSHHLVITLHGEPGTPAAVTHRFPYRDAIVAERNADRVRAAAKEWRHRFLAIFDELGAVLGEVDVVDVTHVAVEPSGST
jgi:hypothetical protein